MKKNVFCSQLVVSANSGSSGNALVITDTAYQPSGKTLNFLQPLNLLFGQVIQEAVTVTRMRKHQPMNYLYNGIFREIL